MVEMLEPVSTQIATEVSDRWILVFPLVVAVHIVPGRLGRHQGTYKE